ncbi:hypothetical protein ACTFIY_007218 [Dictyostelium cf. discoideum]
MNRTQHLFKFRGYSRSFCSSTPVAKPNKLFGSLFPNQTPINPMKEQIYSFEAIDNGTSSPKGTTFKNSLDQPFSPQNVLNKSFLFDENGKIRIEQDEHMMEEYNEDDDEYGESAEDLQSEKFINDIREQSQNLSFQLFKTKKETKVSKDMQYIKFLEKHQSNPNLLCFLIQSATSETDKIFETFQKSLSFEIEESICIQMPDNSLAGRTVSTAISLIPKENSNIDPQSIYKSLSTFGITLNGLRLKVLNASSLKTISLFGLDKNLQEDYFRDYFSESFDPNMKDPKFCRITFSSKVYKPHLIGKESSHSGTAHITFDSHLVAMRAVKALSNSPICSWVGISRYAHTEGTAAADLITILERRRYRQMDDIKLMKDIIDLKSKVRELENEVKKHEDSKKMVSSKRKYLTN